MYMLDTNIVIYAIKKKPKKVLDHISAHKPGELCISSITYAELVHGVEKSDHPDKNWIALSLMLSNFHILKFDEKAAEEYGQIYAELQKAGKPIGQMDALIAGHARSQNCVLVTNNLKEFKRVKNLNIEN